ncbi:MAG: hypothetical protein V2I33_22025 [Kangiellaceae bacterium]|nr:hypothetical protein [Kangiellaceae bacterium]
MRSILSALLIPVQRASDTAATDDGASGLDADTSTSFASLNGAAPAAFDEATDDRTTDDSIDDVTEGPASDAEGVLEVRFARILGSSEKSGRAIGGSGLLYSSSETLLLSLSLSDEDAFLSVTGRMLLFSGSGTAMPTEGEPSTLY